MSGEESNDDLEVEINRLSKLGMRAFILRRPEMFIGRQWNAEGLYFVLFDIMKSAIEPEHANHCSALTVGIESETVFSIMDNGRGLPVESIRLGYVERPKIEWIFTHIITRHPLPAYYEEFGFLDYMAEVLNAVSLRLHVETHFAGQGYELSCAQYEIVDHLRSVLAGGIQKGTRLTFTPDPAIFPDFKFDLESVSKGLGELKREFPAVSIMLEDKITNQKIEIENSV